MRILITGGSSDIARAIAKRRQGLGDEIIITSSNEASLNETLLSYQNQGISASGLVFNFAAPESHLAALDHELSQGIDAIILNAFGRLPKLVRLHELPYSEISTYLSENINGNTFLVSHCLPKMLEKKFGRIVLISSVSATIGTANYGVYAMAKAALEGMILNLAVDYAGDGILSNILRLGLFKTSRTSLFWRRAEYLAKVSEFIPQRVMGEPFQAAEALDPLLSQTSYINGAALNVSGGLPLQSGPRRSS